MVGLELYNRTEAFNKFKEKNAQNYDPSQEVNPDESLQNAWQTINNYAKDKGPQALKYLNKGWDFLKNQGQGIARDVGKMTQNEQNPADSKKAFDQFVEATGNISRYSQFSKVSSDFIGKYYELAKKLQAEGKRYREIEIAISKFVKPGQVFLNQESSALMDQLAESHSVIEEIIEDMKKEVEKAFDVLSSTQTSKNVNEQQVRTLGPGGF